MDGPVDDAEDVVNYIVESSKWKGTDVDHRAFLPGSDGERSVFRIDGLSDENIFQIGLEFVGVPRSKPILGWARIKAKLVRDTKPLQIDRKEPPDRHAAIVNWPDVTEKQQRRVLAMALASDCIPFKR